MFSAATKRAGANLATDIKEGISILQEDMQETKSRVNDDLKELAEEAGRKTRQYVDAGGVKVSEAAASVGGLIRENPVQTGIAALGVGILLGMLLRRR